MNNRLLIFLLLLLLNNCFAQENVSIATSVSFRDSTGIYFSNLISPDSISKTLFKLASAELEGRETGQRGQKEAARLLASKYLSYGLAPGNSSENNKELSGFMQKHTMGIRSNKGRNLSVNGDNFLYGRDFIYLPPDKDTSVFINKIIFCANRSEKIANVLENDRYTSKNIMLFDAEQFDAGSPPLFRDIYPQNVFVIAGQEKINSIFLHGFESSPRNKTYNLFFITEAVAKKFFDEGLFEKLKRKGNKKSVVREIECDASAGLVSNDEVLSGQNVIAKLEGSNSGGEAIIISSHYDHLGKNDSLIYFGADDNASGTSAIVELARVFSEAASKGYKPKRDIIFLNVSGEEKGLLGSSYYVSHPTIPLQNMVADLNIDMIGRTDSIHDSTGVRDYIYVIGADKISTELHTINEEQNKKSVNLSLDYLYNRDDDPNNFYKRSDHYNFAKKGIPVIFYFDGKHADYHETTDVPEKIDLNLLAKRAKLVFLTAWELANRDKRIVVDKK